ncbi:major facilitator superfamily MFS-1 [Phialemonium atrogriseum]|uniref:Major facilitator superfamily MFS-1 n=1 Tax=Phialemonium atrogriseum TaxID=1093897 RepID=A0AAJ0BTR6_9PEZI|nr:major facilitator superfamily MFS-1 [Phialemonium atrogriseum]KAK1763248.1 major facilitator superfamily MFS-1 [Phialemonium atrogriseum]
MKATFHLAPRFTIKPPPDGPLHLGTIVDNLTDMEPVNETCRLPLPGKVYEHRASGFTATRSQLASGRYGVWARFVGVEGVGGEVSATAERSTAHTFRFEHLDEITFTATDAYMVESMNVRDVRLFVEGGGFEPVYMVTGLKIARGPAVSMSEGRSRGVAVELGLSQSGGIEGLEVGPRFERAGDEACSVEWEKSDDFVVGIRVKRLRFKRGFFWRKPGAVVGEHFRRGATLVDNDDTVAAPKGLDEVEADDEIGDDDEDMEDRVRVVDGEETWVVPQS